MIPTIVALTILTIAAGFIIKDIYSPRRCQHKGKQMILYSLGYNVCYECGEKLPHRKHNERHVKIEHQR